MSNWPTKERVGKEDWEFVGKRQRRSDTLGALRSRVGDDVISEAQRWLADWELAVNGYCDAMKNGGEPAVRGNVFTFNALRGKSWRPIKDFWRHAGQERHKTLVQMLAYGWSFSSIGRHNWPNLKPAWSRQKASEYCEETLIMLSVFMKERRKAEARKAVLAARAYEAHPSIPYLCEQMNLAEPGLRILIEKGQKISQRKKHGLTATCA